MVDWWETTQAEPERRIYSFEVYSLLPPLTQSTKRKVYLVDLHERSALLLSVFRRFEADRVMLDDKVVLSKE